MHARSAKLLEDIRDAAAFIAQATQGRTLAEYSIDRLLRHAVERNFEIIGEAIKRLAQHDPIPPIALPNIGRSSLFEMC